MSYRKVWLLASLAIFTLVIGLLIWVEDVADIQHKKTQVYLSLVSVATVKPASHSGVIQVYAEVKPRWSTTISAQVSGECVRVTDRALAGQRVEKGELLLRIEDSAYLVLVHEAELTLSEARLNLLLEQKKAAQAERDWQRSGINQTPSDLTLNKPQLGLAKKTVSTAESRLVAARKTHASTRIRAPFSGLVTVRHVNLGQAVVEGEALLHLIDVTQLEMMISLSQPQWDMLAADWRNRSASIRNNVGIKIGQAHIKRGGGFLDPETRQHKLFLQLDASSSPKVLSGDFVQVQLPGRIVPNALAIPESALTRDGIIWYLDDEDRLRWLKVDVLFYQDDQIIVQAPSNEVIGKYYPQSWRIATTPLASFLAGNRVKPVTLENAVEHKKDA